MRRRVAYLLDRPDLGGGAKVVFQHARLLALAGHDTLVLGRGPRPAWWRPELPRYLDRDAPHLPLTAFDLVVATFWTTLAEAQALALGPVVHLCQGFEGEIGLYSARWPEIEAAYRRRAPTWTVTPRLAALVRERFSRPAHLTPPPLDESAAPRWRWGPRRRPWIAVGGAFEAEVKGVRTGLAVVSHLRAAGLAVRLLRFSVLPLSAEEARLARADDYLVGVEPAVLLRRLAACDLLLAPVRREEGFGLPLLEAMACGVPAIASRTPASEWIAGDAGAILVPANEVGAFSAAAVDLLSDRRRWRAQRARGLAAASRFAPSRVGRELAEAVEWAVAVSEDAGPRPGAR